MPINEKITLDESQVREAIKNLIEDYKKLEIQQKLTAKSGMTSSNEYEKAIQEVLGEVDNLVKKEEELKKKTAETSGELSSAARQFKVFGISVGDVVDKKNKLIAISKDLKTSFISLLGTIKTTAAGMLQFGSSVTNARGGMLGMLGVLGQAQNAFRLFNNVLKASVIGLVITALAGLIAMFTRTQKGIDLVQRGFAILNSTVGNIIDRFAKVGEGLVKIFSGQFREGIAQATGAFKGLGDEIARDAREIDNLTQKAQALRDEELGLTVVLSERRRTLKDLNKDAEDLTKTDKERLKAAEDALAVAKQITDLENSFLERKIANTREIKKLNNSLFEDDKEVLDLIEEKFQKETANLEAITTIQNKRTAITREAAARLKAEQEAEEKRVEALVKSYQDLSDKINEMVQTSRLAQLEGTKRLDAEKELANVSLRLLEENAIKAAELAGATDQEIHDIHLKFIELRKAADRQYAEAVFQINREIEADTIERFENASKSFLPGPELATDFKKALGDALKPEEVFSEFEQGLIDTFGPEVGRKLVESMRKGAEGAVAKSGPGGPFAKIKESLVNALGIKEEELQPIIDAIGTVTDAIVDNIESQIEANDRLLDSIRDQSKSVEDELAKQKDLKEEGFANDTSLNEMKLAQLKKDEQKAIDEQKKLQKQKAAIETVEQVTSLITASANIFRAFSAIPIVGVPLAIAAIATMFGTFIATKARASQATRAYKGGALSDYLGNRSSDFVSPGGASDIPGRGDGYRVEGTNLRIGGDEFLMSEGPAREHAKFLRKMNRGAFKGVDLSKHLALMSTKQPNFAKINSGFEERQRAIDNQDAELNYLAVRDGVSSAISNQTTDLIRYFSKRKRIAPYSKEGYIEYSDQAKTVVKFMKD